MAAVRLDALLLRARQRSNQENSLFCSDVEVTNYLNEGAQKLHEKLIVAYEGEYLEKQASFATVAGQEDYTLPADFFKLLAIDLNVSGRRLTLRQFVRTERNIYRSYITGWWRAPRYRLAGNNLRLEPPPDAAYTGTIFYAPLLQVSVHGNPIVIANLLVNTDDTIDFFNGNERFVVCYAAIQMMKKEETDSRGLEAELARMEAEFIEARSNRNEDQPLQAVDVEAINLDGILP